MIRKSYNLTKLLLVAIAGLVVLFGSEAGHSLILTREITAPATSNVEINAQCQSICPLINITHSKRLSVAKDDTDPDPIPLFLDNYSLASLVSVVVLFGSLGFIYRLRKPPDLSVLFASLRI